MPEGLYELWRDLFETEAGLDVRPVVPVRDVQWELLYPFKIQD